jgi:hypothetical protein
MSPDYGTRMVIKLELPDYITESAAEDMAQDIADVFDVKSADVVPWSPNWTTEESDE